MMRLEASHISYRYPGAEGEVFNDLDLRIECPGFHALFGPSGVGKTTLARLLAGAISGWGGTIDRDGIHRVLYTYNLERLPGWSSVREHLDEIAPAGARARLAELIETCGVAEHIDARFARLSLGQQNRVNLIRYLLQEFDLLVMDESLANVDEATREQIILKIKDLFPERCFLYISHNVAEVAAYCSQVVVLRGPARTPQAVSIQGRDHRNGADPDPAALERVMLEIVHAA
jgi:ABC-type nitrate/sulfonate/bicarbonate transport system ATPase subunit